MPADQITATVSNRARNIAIGGTAGRKRRRLEEERACNEKAFDSKVKYLRPSKVRKAVETVVHCATVCARHPPVSPAAPKLPVRPLVGAAVPLVSLPLQRTEENRQRYAVDRIFLQNT